MATHITVVDTLDDFAALEVDWRRLACLDEKSAVFNGWDWNWLWWQHYGHLGELHILVVHSAAEVIAIAPLYRVRTCLIKLISADTLRFIGSGGDTSPDDLNVLLLADQQRAALTALCDHLLFHAIPSRLQLNDMPEASAFWQHLQTALAGQNGFQPAPVRQGRRCAQLPQTWSVYREQLSRNTRKQIKRRRNRLQRAGQASYQRCRTEHEVDAATRALIALHHARWESKGGVGAFRSVAYVDFHRDLIGALHQRDELWLLTLSLNERIIGVEYAFCTNGTLAFFQTGFDPAFESISPGHMLMTYAIELAIAEGVQQIDLLKGDYAYKSSYADSTRTTISLDYWKPRPWLVLVRMAELLKMMRRRMWPS